MKRIVGKIKKGQIEDLAFEDYLGIPGTKHSVLVSDEDGTRYWEEWVILTTDGDLYIDDTGIIRNNITSYTQQFKWNDGDSQSFDLDYKPTNILAVYVNGLKLDWSTEYQVSDDDTQLIINSDLGNDDGEEFVEIVYEHFIIEP